MPVKRIKTNKKEELEVLVKESCVAETTHIVAAITGFICIRILKNIFGVFISIAYFIWNMLFVIIQRYNRPRLINERNKLEAI